MPANALSDANVHGHDSLVLAKSLDPSGRPPNCMEVAPGSRSVQSVQSLAIISYGSALYISLSPPPLCRLWFDGESWWYWDGRRFVRDEKSAFFVKGVLINQLRIVYLRVRDEWKAKIEATTDEKKLEELIEQLKRLRTYNNTREISSTLELVRGELFASDLAQQLDANPDILNVKNGVLLLRTGELDSHRPQYMCSKIAETDFMVSPSSCFRRYEADRELARYCQLGVFGGSLMHTLLVFSLFRESAHTFCKIHEQAIGGHLHAYFAVGSSG